MRNKSDYAGKYGDLLETASDQQLLRAISDLDAAYKQPALPTHMSWSSVQARHAFSTHQLQKPREAFALRLLGRRRKRWSASMALGLAVVVIALSAFTYVSILPLLGQLFNAHSAIGGLLQKQQFTELHQSKTLDGLTIKLEAAYADANQIIIGYTLSPVQTPDQLGTGKETLQTSDGRTLASYGGVSSYTVGGNANAIAPFANIYDAGSITGNPQNVTLHTVFDVGTGGNPKLGLKPFHKLGTLAFDFTIPFHPGKMLEPHQSLTVHGQTVTLQKVIITPSETRVYVSGLNMSTAYIWASIQVAGQIDRPGTGTPLADGTYRMSFAQPLFDRSGLWKIEISQINRGNGVATSADTATWDFSLTVPAKA